MLQSVIAILGGVIAAAPFIISKSPNSKELIDKLTSYQGWIGIILLIWSILGAFDLLKTISHFNISWIIELGITSIEFIVGFLLSYGLLSKHLLEKSDEAKEKGAELRTKLTQYQIPAGLALIVLGILKLF
ncbi:hypothetical protein UJ101_01954 [Flavobacteriaceae bacterium UJ101]|nr:hypothetical protein UJ101_01954 [Flavobacteriaceae bacterium UJ101]